MFPLHSFDNGLCLDDRLGVELLEISHSVRFKYRTFRFRNLKTINQRSRITWFFSSSFTWVIWYDSCHQKIKTRFKDIKLHAYWNSIFNKQRKNRFKIAHVTITSHVMTERGLIGQNVMVNVSKLDSGRVKILDQFCWIGPQSWRSVHLWSKAFLIRKDYGNHFLRNQNESNEETEERDCQSLCFIDVTNDIDTELEMCSIKKSRTRRRISEFQTEQSMKRLMGGKTVFSGSLSYVVRLTFQSFDQYHSDSQELFQIFFPFRHNLSLRLLENKI